MCILQYIAQPFKCIVLKGLSCVLWYNMPSMNEIKNQHTVIVGAGFTGISCALRLATLLPDMSITLVSDKDYFEYYPALYRVVTGSSPLQACIMLSDIFNRFPNVSCVQDTIVDVDVENKKVVGKQGAYVGEYIVLGVGSENTYFNVEGVAELSFNFKSIHRALHLKERIRELFKNSRNVSPEEKLLNLHFVIVGGGPSGVELAGELASYTKRLAGEYEIDESFITIDLVEAGSRILGRMSEEISQRATGRLRMVGVNVYANRMLIKDESWTVFLKDMKIGSKTVIWAAGVRNNKLFEAMPEFKYDGKARVVVDDYLQAEGFENIFIGGDNARTQYSGMAQTALYDGKYIAETIKAKQYGNNLKKYVPHTVSYDIPIGPGWAVLVHRGVTLYGRVAWWMRHIIDLRFYLSVLPIRKALRIFFSGQSYDYKKHNS